MSNWTSQSVTTPVYNERHLAKSTVYTGPTVSLEARPIVIPILSAMFGFPVLALALICALRYRAKRARLRSHLKRARTSGKCRARHGRGHDFNAARLKVLREPPTFTELSVIGSRAHSSTSDEYGGGGGGPSCDGPSLTVNGEAVSCAAASDSDSYSGSDSEIEAHRMPNGTVRLAFQASPLEILSGTAGLDFGFTCNVVETC